MEKFAISNIEFEDGIKIGQMYYFGEWYKKDDAILFFRSSLYDTTISLERAFELFREDSVSFVKQLRGDFLIICYDSKSNNLTFCSDRLGKDYCYYYLKNSAFALTSDVWVAASILKPSEEDINWQAVKRLIILNNMLIRHSYITGLEMIAPATIYSFEVGTSELSTEKYWELKYKEDKTITIDDTVEKLDVIFDNTFRKLARKFPSDTRFGVGLSGGWDTRIIVHYALKHNLKIVPYCIGQKRLFLFFPTYGYRVAKQIAKYFKLDNFVFIDYQTEDFYQKFVREVDLLPERASNMEIGCLSQIPDFDIMLNGEHGGVFFGEFDWEPVLSYNKQTMSDYLLNFLAFNKSRDMIFSAEELVALKGEVQSYVDNMSTDDQYEIVYKYFYEVLGAQSKRGFFETNYDTKERYTPYLDPDFFDFYLTWNSKFRMDRSLQRRFFVDKLPVLSKMADESTDAPLYWRSLDIHNVPKRFFYGALNYIFKPSLRRGSWLLKDKKFKNVYEKVISRNREIIKSVFPEFDDRAFLLKNPRAASTFMKAIATVDALINSDCHSVEEYLRIRYDLK